MALALARGLSVRAAAKASGYSERQAHRRRADEAFCRRVETIRFDLLDRAVGALQAANVDAVSTLRQLLKKESPPAVRLAAARAILDASVKLSDAFEIRQRLESLEQQVKETQP